MDADLDTLCTVVYCTADDLLPEARANARRRISDAELATLCVAQAIMGIPSDRRFLATAAKRLIHLFPVLPTQSAYWRRRRRLADAIEWLMAHFAKQSPATVTTSCSATRRRWSAAEAARRPSARPSARPPATATAPPTRASTGAFASTCWPLPTAPHEPSRWPIRGATSARWRSSCSSAAGASAAQCSSATRATSGASSPALLPTSAWSWCARRAADEPDPGPHLAPIRQRIESIFWTCKDLLTLERHGARTLAGLRERILQRFLCLAACISLNHRLGRPSRALVDYCA